MAPTSPIYSGLPLMSISPFQIHNRLGLIIDYIARWDMVDPTWLLNYNHVEDLMYLLQLHSKWGLRWTWASKDRSFPRTDYCRPWKRIGPCSPNLHDWLMKKTLGTDPTDTVTIWSFLTSLSRAVYPHAGPESTRWDNLTPEWRQATEKVIALVEGFESEYGVRLLVTAHYLLKCPTKTFNVSSWPKYPLEVAKTRIIASGLGSVQDHLREVTK